MLRHSYLDENDATDVEAISGSIVDREKIYSLAGQQIQKMQKGINIVNDKKILKLSSIT